MRHHPYPGIGSTCDSCSSPVPRPSFPLLPTAAPPPSLVPPSLAYRRIVADADGDHDDPALACLHELAQSRPVIVVGEYEHGVEAAVLVVARICHHAASAGESPPLIFPGLTARGHGLNRPGEGVSAAEGFRTSKNSAETLIETAMEGGGENERIVKLRSGKVVVKPTAGTVIQNKARMEAVREGPVLITFAMMPGSVMENEWDDV